VTKEEIYDNEINPLMGRILQICEDHKIAMIADFALDGEDFHCTSALLEKEYEPLNNQLKAFQHLKPQSSSGGFVALAETTETNPDGSKRITLRRIS
jgi:hypothetical protein